MSKSKDLVVMKDGWGWRLDGGGGWVGVELRGRDVAEVD